MNKHERKDLKFFMDLPDKEWEKFLSESPKDDIEYALHLINCARAEEMVQAMEKAESRQERYGLDCKQAMSIINRVKKGASK
jgi:hypothetical protein